MIRMLGVLAALSLLATPAAAQKSKDTLRLALGDAIQAVNYYLDPKPESIFESEAIHDTLIIFDEKNFKYEPLLATAWTQIDDTTLELDLRNNVKWHDGQPFTADDVIFTYNWIQDPKTHIRFKSNWDFISKVEKAGPNKVRIITRAPTPYQLTRIAYLNFMMPEHSFGHAQDEMVWAATKPIGTGMYKVVSVDKDKALVMERNPDYRHGGTVKAPSNIGRMELRPIPDAGTQVAEFLVGNLDVMRQALDQAEDLAKKPGVALSIGQGTGYVYIAFDAKGRSGVKPLMDPAVRRALLMTIDRQAALKLSIGDHQLPVPKTMCWEFQAGCGFTKSYPAYDPAAAKRALAEAGYPDGFEVEITTFTTESIKQVAQLVANGFRAAGVKATVAPRTIDTYRKMQGDGKIQVIVAGWPGGGAPDVQGTIDFIYAPPESRDYTGDKTLQEMAAKSITLMDPAARTALGTQVFDRSIEQAYFMPIVPSGSAFVHTADVTVKPGSFNDYGVNPQDIRWK